MTSSRANNISEECENEPNNNLGPDSQPLFGENGSIDGFDHASKVGEETESCLEVESDDEMIIDEKIADVEKMEDSNDSIIEFKELVDPIPPTIDLNQR